MAKKTKKNPKGAGRKELFLKKYGTSKRISVSIPSKEETEVKQNIKIILEPYKNK